MKKLLQIFLLFIAVPVYGQDSLTLEKITPVVVRLADSVRVYESIFEMMDSTDTSTIIHLIPSKVGLKFQLQLDSIFITINQVYNNELSELENHLNNCVNDTSANFEKHAQAAFDILTNSSFFQVPKFKTEKWNRIPVTHLVTLNLDTASISTICDLMYTHHFNHGERNFNLQVSRFLWVYLNYGTTKNNNTSRSDLGEFFYSLAEHYYYRHDFSNCLKINSFALGFIYRTDCANGIYSSLARKKLLNAKCYVANGDTTRALDELLPFLMNNDFWQVFKRDAQILGMLHKKYGPTNQMKVEYEKAAQRFLNGNIFKHLNAIRCFNHLIFIDIRAQVIENLSKKELTEKYKNVLYNNSFYNYLQGRK